MPASLPWIEKLVAIDTTSRDSNLPLIDVVADAFRAHGLEPRIFPSPDGTKANLVATIPAANGEVRGGVVLSGHTDVVPVDGQPWSFDPFTPQVRDGRLYGRGTCDMKGFIGSVMHALPVMAAAELTEPIHVALSYDEELGCLGGAELVQQITDLGIAPRVAVVGEPTMMRLVRGHKSIHSITVDFHGVTVHSSLKPQGVNALEYAAEFVLNVRALSEQWRDQGPHDEDYLVPHSTTGVNVLHGGLAGNIVPDTASLTLDLRTIAADDQHEVAGRMRTWVTDLDARMKTQHPAAGATLTVLADVPGLDTPSDSAAVDLALRLGAHPEQGKVTYGTEAGQFAGIGISTVVCGPGDIAQAHAADEFVSLDQIEQCEGLLARLVTLLSAPSAPLKDAP